MGSTNVGSQIRSIGFYDPADSGVVNKRGVGVQERGIYSGGYLTKSSDSSFLISPLVCVIGDSDYQLRIQTTVAATITGASPTNKYVVLRWTYTGDKDTDYMDILVLSIGNVLENDIIVGVCVYVGSSLIGFDYGDSVYPRTEPKIASLTGKVEAESPSSMYVRIRSCVANCGGVLYNITNQRSGVISVSPSSRYDVVYIDTDGTVKVQKGVDSVSPTVPTVSGKIILANIYITSADTSIKKSMIIDQRAILGSYPILGTMAVQNSDAVTLTGNLLGGNNQLTGICLENRTNDNGCTQTGRIWIRTDI